MREKWNKFLKDSKKIPSHVFFFRCKIQHRPPTKVEPKNLASCSQMNASHRVCQIWWGPRLFSLRFRFPSASAPGLSGFGGGKKGGKSGHHIFDVRVCQDFLFYLEFRMVIRRSTFTSRKEIKNFFLTFHCIHILRKETSVFRMPWEAIFVPWKAVFICLPWKASLQFSSNMKDKKCDFSFCLLVKIQIQQKRKKRNSDFSGDCGDAFRSSVASHVWASPTSFWENMCCFDSFGLALTSIF